MAYHSTRQSQLHDPQSRKLKWPTAVKFLEHIPGGRLLKKDRQTEIAKVNASIEYDGDDDDYCEAPGRVRAPVDVQELVKQEVGRVGDAEI